MKLTIGEVVKAVGGELKMGSPEETITGVSTDTRTLRRGDLFFALKGERDGHRFVADALAKGAVGAVVSEWKEGNLPKGKNIIQVEETLRTLGDLASFWRKRFPIPVVAITGSNGKTTTKEMVAKVLSKKFRLLKTEGNFNNLIGLPLTIFQLHRRIQMAVLEMGTNAAGEIDRLAEIAGPEVGVITNIGRAHLLGLKTVEGVAEAKGELVKRLPPRGRAFLNADDPFSVKLAAMSTAPVTTFGQKQGDVKGERIHMKGLSGSSFEVEGEAFQLKVPGDQNVSNALAAIAVGKHFAVSSAKIREALRSFRMPGKRMEKVICRGVTILNDTYNANPDSMKGALSLLGFYSAPSLHFTEEIGATQSDGKLAGGPAALADAGKGHRTIAILGDMFELGRDAVAAHREMGEEAKRLGIHFLVAVGDFGEAMAKGARGGRTKVWNFRTVAPLEKEWPLSLKRGDVVLIKGSRRMKMERVTAFLCETLRKKKKRT